MASTVTLTNNTTTITSTDPNPNPIGSETFFHCPVAHCNQRVHMAPRQIAGHITKAHPKIAAAMGLGPGKMLAFICKHCDLFTKTPHYHCFECEHPENGGKPRHFKTEAERVAHLKTDHHKWYLEHKCKHGSACHGKNGGCGFNHILEQAYIDDIADLPQGLCRYERPWEGVRCKREKCSFDHIWGRVRSDIKKAGLKASSANQQTDANANADAGEETDTDAETVIVSNCCHCCEDA